MTPGGMNSLWTSLRESKKMITIVLIFYLVMRAFFHPGDCCVCHFSPSLLVSGSYLKNQLLSLFMTWVENCFRFEPFRHFCWHFVLSCNMIVVQMFWNHLCTHLSHFKILLNNMVDYIFINIQFIGDHSHCQMSILTNEALAYLPSLLSSFLLCFTHLSFCIGKICVPSFCTQNMWK